MLIRSWCEDPINRTVRDARVCVRSGLDTSGAGREQRVVANRDSGRGQEPAGQRGPVNVGY